MEICERVCMQSLSGNLFMKIQFFSYQTLSDLCEPKTIKNHFLHFSIHEKFKIIFLLLQNIQLNRPHPPTQATNTREKLRRRKIDAKVFYVFVLRLDGWMAAEWQMDPSRFELHNLKLLWCSFWITNTSTAEVLFHSQVKGGKMLKQVEANLKAKPLLSSRTDLTPKGFTKDFPAKSAAREEITQIDEWHHRAARFQFLASIVFRVSFWKALFLISTVNFCHPRNPRLWLGAQRYRRWCRRRWWWKNENISTQRSPSAFYCWHFMKNFSSFSRQQQKKGA